MNLTIIYAIGTVLLSAGVIFAYIKKMITFEQMKVLFNFIEDLISNLNKEETLSGKEKQKIVVEKLKKETAPTVVKSLNKAVEKYGNIDKVVNLTYNISKVVKAGHSLSKGFKILGKFF